jgi:hypothetical protein
MLFVTVKAWKSYDELEENMSLPEIIATLEQMSQSDWTDKRFMASLQGVKLDDIGSSEETETEKEVMTRIVSKANAILSGQDPNAPDIAERQKFAELDIDYETF